MTADLPELFDNAPFVRLSPRESSEYRASLNLLALVPARDQMLPTIHELSHFFEHSTTPFGFFRDEMYRRQVLLFQELMKKLRGNVVTPVYTWASKLLDGTAPPSSDTAELIDQYVRPWSVCTRVLQVLDGSSAEPLQAALARNEAVHLAEVESPLAIDGADRMSSWKRHGIGFQDERSTACPSWTWEDHNIRTFGGGAEHVSEMIAQVQEGLGACVGCKNEWKYLALAFKVIERIGADRYPHMKRHGYVTSLTLGDLALFTPIGSFYGRLRPEGSAWEDIHPGYRFQRALDVIAEEDLWLSEFRGSEHVANAVCDKLGWTRPRDFLVLGATNPHEDARRHAEACKIRLADPMTFYDLSRLGEHGSAIRTFFEKHMPVTIHPAVGAVCCYPDGHTEPVVPIQQIRDYFVNRLCEHVC